MISYLCDTQIRTAGDMGGHGRAGRRELEQLYTEGGPFPDYLDREFVILLEASSGEGQSTLLILPDSPARLERLLCRTGIRDSP